MSFFFSVRYYLAGYIGSQFPGLYIVQYWARQCHAQRIPSPWRMFFKTFKPPILLWFPTAGDVFAWFAIPLAMDACPSPFTSFSFLSWFISSRFRSKCSSLAFFFSLFTDKCYKFTKLKIIHSHCRQLTFSFAMPPIVLFLPLPSFLDIWRRSFRLYIKIIKFKKSKSKLRYF